MEIALKFVPFGLFGLLGAMLWYNFQVLHTEQDRSGAPRKRIVQMAFGFMIFGLVLVSLAVWAQNSDAVNRLEKVSDQLQTINGQLCGKIFFEVNRVKAKMDPVDVADLALRIRDLRAATATAWEKAQTSGKKLEDCPPM